MTPLQPGTVYFGGNVLFRSRDYGNSWEVISPDLTWNPPHTQASYSGATGSICVMFGATSVRVGSALFGAR